MRGLLCNQKQTDDVPENSKRYNNKAADLAALSIIINVILL